MARTWFGTVLSAVVCGALGATRPAAAAAPESGGDGRSFILATFNVRCPGDKGDLAWYRRMPRVAQVVRDNGFDVFGVQECQPYQAKILDAELPGFRRVGCGREKNGEEGVFVYYATNRFECLESETFWLSDTPNVPGSKHPDAGCPRCCTWALLRDRATGKPFRYFNTHLDHMSVKANWCEMKVLMDRGVMPAKGRGETVVLTGDMNTMGDEEDLRGPWKADAGANSYFLASTELTDTYRVSARPHEGPRATLHLYREKPVTRIDYIFATPDVQVLRHRTITDMPEGKFPSDHYPVAAVLRIAK